MSTVSLRELRNNLGAVVREVAYTGREAVITDNGREVAVIISLEDYERLLAITRRCRWATCSPRSACLSIDFTELTV